MDGASVRSGLLGHGRTDSISGSIGSPLASPKDPKEPVRLSRRSFDWKDDGSKPPPEDEEDEEEGAIGRGKYKGKDKA